MEVCYTLEILLNKFILLTGFSYAFQWLITLPLELVASSITLQYWGLSHRIKPLFITIFLAAIILINITGVRGFGNVEAFFSILKVIAVVGFM
jgi:yeast amino acid transporter